MGFPGDAWSVLAVIGGLVLLAILVVTLVGLTTIVSDKVTEAVRRRRVRERQEEAQGQFNEDSPLWPGV